MSWFELRASALPLVGLAAVLLSGCGFQMQGSFQPPPGMERTALQASDPDSEVALGLARALRDAGVALGAADEKATAILQLLTDESGERVLSVSATGVPEEYELYHTVRFTLSREGEVLIDNYPLTVTRDYQFDETDVLGKRKEAEFLQAAMAQDLVGLILRRIRLEGG